MTVHKDRKHADFGFSSMSRTRECPGWVQFWKERLAQYKKRFKKDWEEKQSAPAAEGERKHELSEKIILETESIDNIPDEDRDAIQCYTGLVDDIYSQHNPETVEYEVEQTLSLEHLGGDCWGTPDCIIWSPNERLDVIDAKFGRGLVEPEDNYQLLSQALGTVEREDIGSFFREIYLWISQPLVSHEKGPNRAWEIDPSKLRLWRVELADILEIAQKPNAPLCAGAHCKWCPNLEDMEGIPSCPEIQLEAKALARTEFSDFDPVKPEKLSDSQLVMILEAADAFRQWLDNCELEGYNRQMRGDNIPDAKLVRSPGRSTIDKQAYDKFIDDIIDPYMGVDYEDAYKQTPITVADFRKLMEKCDIDHAEWKHVIKKGEGTIKLVTGADTRTEYIPARIEFDD